ncbi:MAG: ferritin-like domain-containing protein [Actinobacteria bacterium]|nr:ferritin-like domain-containing protein [Actinomycetota bacterium]
MAHADFSSASIGLLREDQPDELFASGGGERGADDGATSRSALLKRAVAVGGAAVATGGVVTALPKLASSAAATARDARILNYVLRLEYLKAAFYEEARAGVLTGELLQFADVLAGHERRHVAFLRKRLGKEAEDQPRFDFGDATKNADAFAATARTLEETAVSAYIGQGANLTRRNMVGFAQIASVEARHAAWIADVLGRDPAPLVADKAKTPAQVLAVIEKTGFEAPS